MNKGTQNCLEIFWSKILLMLRILYIDSESTLIRGWFLLDLIHPCHFGMWVLFGSWKIVRFPTTKRNLIRASAFHGSGVAIESLRWKQKQEFAFIYAYWIESFIQKLLAFDSSKYLPSCYGLDVLLMFKIKYVISLLLK